MIKEKLKMLRKEKNLTQIEVAEALKISKTCYAGYEQGYREPDLKMLKELAIFYDTTTDFLLGLEDENGEKINIANSYRNIKNINNISHNSGNITIK